MLPIKKDKRNLFWRAADLTRKTLRRARVNELETTTDDRPYAHVTINGSRVRGLLDSGATISCLGKNALETVQRLKLTPKNFRSSVQTASGEGQTITGYADVEVEYAGQRALLRFFLIPSLAQELYLGVDFWRTFGLLPLKVEEVAVPSAPNPNQHQLDDDQQKTLTSIMGLFFVERSGRTRHHFATHTHHRHRRCTASQAEALPDITGGTKPHVRRTQPDAGTGSD